MSAMQNPKTRDKLDQWFPGKQINRMISFRRRPRPNDNHDPLSPSKPSCPLFYNERIVYSFLLFRCKRNGRNVPASISKLARLSNLHRSTVKKALEGLAGYRIVCHRTKGWELVVSDRNSRLPNPEWYGFRSKECTVGQLSYHYFVQPDKGTGVRIIDSLVMVADRLGTPKSSACLAGRFGVNKKTIQRVRRKKATITEAAQFKEIQYKPKPKKPTTKQDFITTLEDPCERRLAVVMLQAPVPLTQDEVKEFIEEIRHRYKDVDARMYFLIKVLGDDPNWDIKKTVKGVLGMHKGSKSWLGLLRFNLGWGQRP